MIITQIELFRVNMPLVYPFRTSFGDAEEIESIIVRMQSGASVGWGESTPWHSPGYSSEFAQSAYICIREFLAPLILDREVESGENLQELLAPIRGNYFAKAALDSAWWDLHARMNEVPLWKVLGGTDPQAAIGADFGVMESLDALVEAVASAVDAGFERTKLKFRPGWELDMVDVVRRSFPEHTLHVDCNSAYRVGDFTMLKELDNYGLAMVEQPLNHDDLFDHSQLANLLRIPICLDESITSVDRARKAIEMNACRWINIKPGRLGGLTVARQVLSYCESKNIPCWIGGMLESSLGGHQCLALATLPNVKYPSDVFPSDRFYSDDLSKPELRLSGRSRLTAPDTPGSGAAPDERRLQECTVEYAEVAGSL